MRILGARTSGSGVIHYLELMGQRPFAWQPPNGYPLRASYWSSGLVPRWNFALDLARNQIGETWINLDALRRATRGKTPADICRRLSESLLPTPLAAEQLESLAALAAIDNGSSSAAEDNLSQCLALLLMSPQFQWC